MGRTDEEIRKAREEWMTSDRFGEVKGYDGDRLDAPEVPATSSVTSSWSTMAMGPCFRSAYDSPRTGRRQVSSSFSATSSVVPKQSPRPLASTSSVRARASMFTDFNEGTDAILKKTAGHRFYNTSPFTFSTILSDDKNLAANLRDYINKLSPSAYRVIEAYDFEGRIERIADVEHELLARVVAELHAGFADALAVGKLRVRIDDRAGFARAVQHRRRPAQHGDNAGRLLEQGDQALVLFLAIALRPLVGRAPGDVEELRSLGRGPAVLDDQPRQPQSVIRGQCRVSVSNEGLPREMKS